MADTTIALDTMGGDFGPKVTVPAALKALAQHTNLKLILVGKEDIIRSQLLRVNSDTLKRLTVHNASQTVDMNEQPAFALRNKKDSSMRVAINLVKEKQAQACVSAGNTGALMASARFVLKTLPGIDRPALISELPTIARRTRLLDLGANIDSYAEHLFQFAVMGSVLASAVDNIPKPTVALLNIGAEEIKGNDRVKQAAQLLMESDVVNYIGYIEGHDIFKGNIDIIVCDGFVGNVALKTSEGMAHLISIYIKKTFHQNILTRLAGLITLPVLKLVAKNIDPGRYNGASLLGLNGIVIKSHGSANTNAFQNAINEAIVEVQKNVPFHIRERIANLLNEGMSA